MQDMVNALEFLTFATNRPSEVKCWKILVEYRNIKFQEVIFLAQVELSNINNTPFFTGE